MPKYFIASEAKQPRGAEDVTVFTKDTMVRISIVVCTYNRSDLLAGCLESLEEQTLASSRFEVIIVDNNSTDGTRELAEGFCARNANFRYCFESKQGLSHARNRGRQEALGDWVGYIDDDAKASSNWVETAGRIAAEERPDIFGGPYYAFYQCPKPQWFTDRYESDDKGPNARALGPGEFLNGTNMFFRRELLSELGGFDPMLGMSAGKTAYGEETALMIAARERFKDVKIYYDPELYVFHLVPPRKMQLTSLARQRFVAGRWSTRIFAPSGGHSFVQTVAAGIKVIVLSLYLAFDLAGSAWRDRTAYPFPQNYVYEHSFPLLVRLGAAWEKLIAGLRGSAS